MKKGILLATLALILILAIPVQAATLFSFQTQKLEVKQPLFVELAEDTPAIPNILWPGDTLKWRFKVSNVSPRDYYVAAGVNWQTESGDLWLESPEVSIGGTKLGQWEPFLVPAKSSMIVTVSVRIATDSPPASGVTFSPQIYSVREPKAKG